MAAMSLLDDLRKLGDTFTPSELPGGSADRILAAVVKVLEHAGTTVADELHPKPPPPAISADAAGAVPPDKLQALDDLMKRLEAALSAVESTPEPVAAPAAEVGTAPAAQAQVTGAPGPYAIQSSGFTTSPPDVTPPPTP